MGSPQAHCGKRAEKDEGRAFQESIGLTPLEHVVSLAKVRVCGSTILRWPYPYFVQLFLIYLIQNSVMQKKNFPGSARGQVVLQNSVTMPDVSLLFVCG
jgi:hypothetical protein